MLLLYAAGKIFGTKKDYIIAEAEYQEGEGEEEEEEEGEDEGIQLYREDETLQHGHVTFV